LIAALSGWRSHAQELVSNIADNPSGNKHHFKNSIWPLLEPVVLGLFNPT
jgi:hypothetical protein